MLMRYLSAQYNVNNTENSLAIYPLVSIIIVTYNYEAFLGEAIESILNQTYKNIEVIVVDDGSTDNTQALIKRYPVKLILQEHQGFAAARNNGIKQSKGEFFFCLDGDDKIFPAHIEKTLKKIINNPHVGFVTTGSKIWYVQTKFENIWMPRKIRFRYSVFAGWVAALGSILTRRAAFESLPTGYDTKLAAHEDLDLAFRLLRNWKSETVFEPLHWYRRHVNLIDPQMAEKRRLAGLVLDKKYKYRQLYRRAYEAYKATFGRSVSFFSHPFEYLKSFREKYQVRSQLKRSNPRFKWEAEEYAQQIYATLDMQFEWCQNRELHRYYNERIRILKNRLNAY
jgi:glycosyltransferase involved in cell wall biosynthesis